MAEISTLEKALIVSGVVLGGYLLYKKFSTPEVIASVPVGTTAPTETTTATTAATTTSTPASTTTTDTTAPASTTVPVTSTPASTVALETPVAPATNDGSYSNHYTMSVNDANANGNPSDAYIDLNASRIYLTQNGSTRSAVITPLSGLHGALDGYLYKSLLPLGYSSFANAMAAKLAGKV
jgi:hypothetical protein